MRFKIFAVGVIAVIALLGGGQTMASASTSHTSLGSVVSPDAGEHGGPGQCTAARDGEIYVDYTGKKFICANHGGGWQWVLYFGCSPKVAANSAVEVKSNTAVQPRC